MKPSPDYVAIARFRSALRSFDSAAEEAARASGLTFQRYLLLLMIKGAPAGDERATINDIADRIRVAPHTVTGAIDRAEEAGLVVREQCTEDRRRIWIRLTPEGEKRLAAVVAAMQAQRQALVATIEEVAAEIREVAAADDLAAAARRDARRTT